MYFSRHSRSVVCSYFPFSLTSKIQWSSVLSVSTADGAFQRQVLISSIKGEVKKKHTSFGWSFSCFTAHLNERDLF